MADNELLKSAMENELLAQAPDDLVWHTDDEILHLAQQLSQRMTCKLGHSWSGIPITMQVESGKVHLVTKPLCVYCMVELLNKIAVNVEEDK